MTKRNGAPTAYALAAARLTSHRLGMPSGPGSVLIGSTQMPVKFSTASGALFQVMPVSLQSSPVVRTWIKEGSGPGGQPWPALPNWCNVNVDEMMTLPGGSALIGNVI